MGPLKISTLVFMLAVFLVGEYAVVTFGPHPPDRRKQLVMQLPVVKQVRMWQYRQEIRQAFEEQGDSFTWTHKDSTHTWTHADDLISDAEKGSWVASLALNRLRYLHDMSEEYVTQQRRARSGDLLAMGHYYNMAIALGERQDSTEAGSFLAHHPSATARSLVAFRLPGFDFNSRESQLLIAEAARENFRYPTMREDHYRQMSESNREYLDELRNKAEQGDADAQWVVEQLALRPVWQPAAQ